MKQNKHIDTAAYVQRIRTEAERATINPVARWDAVQLARHLAAALNARYEQGYEDGISGAKRAQLTGIEVEADETARRFIEDAHEAYCAGYADGAADRREA